ncbi:MAG: glycoside hydrolase domain-containing protein [Candidatus Hydrogenedentales bacterium]|jgi:hypothetical protein
MRKCRIPVFALLLALTTAVAVAQPEAVVRVVPSTVRVRPYETVEGALSATVAAAKNEVESFQVAILAQGGPLEGVRVEAGPLTQGDYVIPASRVRLYREECVPIRRSGYRASEGPGLIRDPLVPLVDPYTGDALGKAQWSGDAAKMLPGRFGGSPFDVWPDQNQMLWVDIAVPKDAPAGTYTGALTLSAKDIDAVELPVTLTVWDFALPDGPTHENHFGGVERVHSYLGLERNSDEFHRIEERYEALLAEHRINPAFPRRLWPAIQDDGTTDFSEVDDAISAFVDQFHVTNLEIPRAPFGDTLGENREKAKNFMRSWYAYLDGKGWAGRSYHYMLDEPNTPDEYETVRKLGALVNEAEPRIRRLVVEQPYTQNPAWGVLDGAFDIWCPLFGFIHEPSVAEKQAQGDEVWSYTALFQRAPDYHPEYEKVKGEDPPYWQIDVPLVSYRIAPWLNRRYGITGLLYWSTCYWGSPDRNPWDEPGFRGYWNGDGALLYPGADAGLEGPIGSLRLKSLRDGMEDYEYFVILEQRGGAELVEAIVREAVPTWGSWNQDPDALPRLRARLAEAITARAP